MIHFTQNGYRQVYLLQEWERQHGGFYAGADSLTSNLSSTIQFTYPDFKGAIPD